MYLTQVYCYLQILKPLKLVYALFSNFKTTLFC